MYRNTSYDRLLEFTRTKHNGVVFARWPVVGPGSGLASAFKTKGSVTLSLPLSWMVDRISRFKETTPLLSSTEFRTEPTVCWTATHSCLLESYF
ncbi:unnamed protein product [Larinioides sclopetarius]|uniref:Uncharacterized protein n=1 Tax=Larinioides sclopetarius TaxID=280406 RepID=A0AAV2A0S6_9ARAC